jgi:ABC-type multidrug transport system fused ATPase/permease subunit
MWRRLKSFRLFVGEEVWKYFLIVTTLGPVWFLVESSFVFVLQGFLFSIGLLTKSQIFLPHWYPTSLSASVLILIGFGTARALTQILKLYYSNLIQVAFTCEQRKGLLSYGLNHAEIISSKEIITIFMDITGQAGGVILYLSGLANVGISTLLLLFMGFSLAPIEMGIGITLLALFMWPLKLVTKRINHYGQGLLSEWENLNETLLRGLRNNFFLKIYKQVNAEVERGTEAMKRYQNHFINYTLIAGFVGSFPILIGIFILSLITYSSVKFIHTDPIKLISCFYIFIRVAQAASETNTTLAALRLSFPGLKVLYRWRMRHIEDLSHLKRTQKEAVVVSSQDITLQAQDLSFQYVENYPLFENLHFSLGKGEVLVIKGESGSGKSTLLSIILGLNLPTRGRILVNGISTLDKQIDLHKVLAYVGPEAYLIQGTVRENLLYGLNMQDRNKISDDSIWKTLELMEMKKIILELPLKLDEPLKDITQISTGQKQRLSLTRALLRNPSLLILDEATANLDSITENTIIDNLKNVLKNCTSIIVTHKDSFDEVATKQIRLDA